MKTDWDYTSLANAYLKRPDYSEEAIDKMINLAGLTSVPNGGWGVICDIGAGAAHLTIPLLKRGFTVCAIEPNDAMRANGIKRTAQFKNVQWFEGVGEHTNQPADHFDLVTFGSSFNVTNQQEALQEAHRILKPGRHFVCLWNHRDLNDDVQQSIENIIKTYAKDYDYGSRRADQTPIIRQSGLFDDIQQFSGRVVHSIAVKDIVEAWRSHGTLFRQVGDKFDTVINEIEKMLNARHSEFIDVPYETHGWIAKAIK